MTAIRRKNIVMLLNFIGKVFILKGILGKAIRRTEARLREASEIGDFQI